MKKMFALAICLILLGTSSKSDAYNLLPFKVSTTVDYLPHQNFGSQSISDFNDALYQWNAQAGQSLMMRYANSRHNTYDYPSIDKQDKIYRTSIGIGYIAQNTYAYSGGVLKESDINFNIYYPFSNSGDKGTYDVYSVFLHETGHTIGLHHSDTSAAVMFATTPTGVQKRVLHSDDRAGVNIKY